MSIRMLLSLTLLSLLSASPALAQFQGVITMSMYRDDGTAGQQMTQSIKGSMVRMDMAAEAGGISTIIDAKDGSMTSLMHAQKMYMKMNMKAMADQMQAMVEARQQSPASARSKVSKTGRSETVAGHSCEHYLIESERDDLDMCIAKGIGMFGFGTGGGGPFGMGRGMPQMPAGWEEMQAEFKDGGYPLKMERVKDGKRTIVMMVKSIEAKPLDDALFQAPAGYREFQMPGR